MREYEAPRAPAEAAPHCSGGVRLLVFGAIDTQIAFA